VKVSLLSDFFLGLFSHVQVSNQMNTKISVPLRVICLYICVWSVFIDECGSGILWVFVKIPLLSESLHELHYLRVKRAKAVVGMHEDVGREFQRVEDAHRQLGAEEGVCCG